MFKNSPSIFHQKRRVSTTKTNQSITVLRKIIVHFQKSAERKTKCVKKTHKRLILKQEEVTLTTVF